MVERCAHGLSFLPFSQISPSGLVFGSCRTSVGIRKYCRDKTPDDELLPLQADFLHVGVVFGTFVDRATAMEPAQAPI